MAPTEAVSPQRKGSKSRTRRLGPRGGDDPIKVGVCAMEKKVCWSHRCKGRDGDGARTRERWVVPCVSPGVHQSVHQHLASTARTASVSPGAIAVACAAWALPW